MPTYWVQVFERAEGRVVPSRRIPVSGQAEARATAAAMFPTVPAAAALCLVSDDDGRICTTTIIAAFGDVPHDYPETLLQA